MRYWLGFLAGAVLAAPVFADAPRLIQPIDCALGATCYIQNYVDRAPTKGRASDVMCNGLTYDGHKGTDFALHSLQQMHSGVNVLAAATGIVRGMRDEMPDSGLAGVSSKELANRECGNGVIIDHGTGWQTLYCHMKRGSVSVRKGDRVQAGDILGEVGLSGKTEFPHLHLSLLENKRIVDPFEASDDSACGVQGDSYWEVDPGYQAGGVIRTGFADSVPAFERVKSGEAHVNPLPSDAPALVVWGYAFGVRRGDVLELTVTGPENFTFSYKALIKKDQALAFRAAGKKRKHPSWPIGDYVGISKLVRQGEIISSQHVLMKVLPKP